jgi:ribulose-bisphosphate carboxylase large chain|uniref:Ribulose 1,5-bisphosphate carboxylase large subunit n=1 Tax=Leptospirillum ferriphilum TaxID=178606 RepID=A0A7C3QWG0_9BACT
MTQEIIRATYTITSGDIRKAASLVAREMSLGVKKTHFENRSTEGFEARVGDVREAAGKAGKAVLSIDVPCQNIASLYGLLLSIAGEISCLNILKTIELTDFVLPSSLVDRLPGPRFGLEGIKKARKNVERPLFITVIKPSQGLSPAEYGKIAYESLVGGMDVVKSDELLQEPRGRYVDRLKSALEAARRAESETGEPKWVMMHTVDLPSQMRERFLEGARLGSRIAMLSPAASGFPMLEELARLEKAPIMAHMAMSGWLWHKDGMSVRSWSKFMRLAGADIVLYPALEGTLKSSRRDLKDVHDACLVPMGNARKSMIAVGGGMHAGTMGVHHKMFGADFVYLCGGGVCAHPGGPRAGGKSIRQAWEAHSRGISLEKFRKEHKELDQALEAFRKYV